MKSESPRDLRPDEGGEHTWNEGRVIGDTDADDLDSEHGCRKRGPEDRPEAAAHAAHDHDFLISLIHMEHIAEIISDASADL